jgi:hypothetical protein
VTRRNAQLISCSQSLPEGGFKGRYGQHGHTTPSASSAPATIADTPPPRSRRTMVRKAKSATNSPRRCPVAPTRRWLVGWAGTCQLLGRSGDRPPQIARIVRLVFPSFSYIFGFNTLLSIVPDAAMGAALMMMGAGILYYVNDLRWRTIVGAVLWFMLWLGYTVYSIPS